MYAGNRYGQHPDRAAFVMASTGESVTYAELEQRSNRLAHLLRSEGLRRLDHYAVFMENNNRYLECCAAGERSGLYYTCISSYLTADELAYIVDNSEAKVIVADAQYADAVVDAAARCPGATVRLSVGTESVDDLIWDLSQAFDGLGATR